MSPKFMGPLSDKQRRQKEVLARQKKQFTPVAAPPKPKTPKKKPETRPWMLPEILRRAAGKK
jgi:hypothetical protein